MTQTRDTPRLTPAPRGLESILRPRSVAVIGASTRRGTIGGEIFHNLIETGFEGPVYPVNPKTQYVQSVPAYASVADIPGPVDLAVVVVPRRFVLPTLEECAKKGVRGAVVISAGYKETGPEGAAEERKLQDFVREKGIRLIGPNCLGVLSTEPGTRLNATFAPTWPPEGGVGIASQSGALGLVILDYAKEFNVGVSEFVSMGNKADVSGNDLIEWWGKDPRTDVILLYLESFGNPDKFIRLAREVGRRKPIVAVKSGRSKRGSKAASSHTGALAGAEAAVQALMKQTGVIRVDTVEELFDMAAFLAHQPVPEGNRVAILTNAGGPGILATDACETWKLEIPDLDPTTVQRLQEFLPAAASVKNPVDMIASATASDYEQAVKLLLADPNVDALIVIFVPPIVTEPRSVGAAIVAAAEGATKPVMSCFLGRQGVPERLRSMKKAHIPSYAFPETAVRVLARAVHYGEWLRRAPGNEVKLTGVDAGAARKVVEGARRRLGAEGGWLSPEEISGVLGAYGIPMNRARFAETAEAAMEAAEAIGYPVVVKLESSLTHKSDVGGVKLDLRSAGEVRGAVEAIRAALAERGLEEKMLGVTVSAMIKGGVEIIAGATQDPLFGPLIMFGLGGVHVELMKDVALRIHPLTDDDVSAMVREVKGYPLLTGYRGTAPSDIPAVEDLLQRISTLAGDHPELQEMDLNPVKVRAKGKGLVAVDARILLGGLSG